MWYAKHVHSLARFVDSFILFVTRLKILIASLNFPSSFLSLKWN